MPRVVHFEIPADKPERAVAFYKNAFQWDIKQWGTEKYWLASTGPKDQMGIDGAIMPRMKPDQVTVNTIGVENLDASIAKVKKAGGKIIGEKMKIPEVGWFVYAVDTEGNQIGILQPDPMMMPKP